MRRPSFFLQVLVRTRQLAAPQRRARGLLVVLSTLVSFGCASIPKGRAAVDSVHVTGNDAVDDSEVEGKIATTASPKFLGLFQGVVYDYEVFNRYVLERDLARVERYYHARGFYRARARAGRIFYDDPKHVRVSIVVEEGPPTTIHGIVLRGLEKVPEAVREAARTALTLRMKRGDRFDEDVFKETEAEIQRALTDRGYAYATVVRTAQVDVVRNIAMLAFDASPDEPAIFGPIRFEGLGGIPEGPVRRAIDIQQGEPYSTTVVEEAQQAALDLGVFSSVQIGPDLAEPRPTPRVIPLVVRVQPTKLRTVRLGGGVQIDTLRTDVHGLIGWEDRNFFGGLRSFNVEFRPAVVLYPTRLPSLEAPSRFLPAERLRFELRQPGFVEARTNAFLRGEFNIYPVLLTPNVDEDAPILGYQELRGAIGVDRNFGRHVHVSPSHNVQLNTPFVYAGELDPSLKPLLISYPELFATLDFRDDRVSPRKGFYLSGELQVAGLGGDVRDFRIQPEARFYVPLSRRITLGFRALTGLLFPQNYAEPTPSGDKETWARDAQISFFRGFFSGGANSNRGYPMRGIGPHGPIPFFDPELASDQIQNNCTPGAPDYEDKSCRLPLGGFTLWEVSAEVRFPVSGPISGTVFCDASDVAAGRVEYTFQQLHLSCGPGLRYETPIGPIRADIGFRIPGAQSLSGELEDEPEPPEMFGLIPAAVAIGIGEAF